MNFSPTLVQLWEEGLIWTEGVLPTLYLTAISTVLAYIIGMPLGILLHYTSKDGIKPIAWLNKTLGIIVNILRSVPFIILMVALIPFARLIVGKSYGNSAMIVTLVIAAFPYIARMVESSIKEVDKGVIEAAQSMGISNFKLITKVLIPEAKPSLITGAVISTVTVLSYTAMASTISADGLGAIAIINGHQQMNNDVIWVCCLLIVIIVQVIQEIGMLISRKSDKRIRN